MKLDRRVVRRLGRKPARKTTSRFSLEQLEARQLLAGSVTISLAGTTTTITAPILANLGDYGNSTDYSITPSAVAVMTSDLTIHANGAITISDPVANFGYNLDAESKAYIAVDADLFDHEREGYHADQFRHHDLGDDRQCRCGVRSTARSPREGV